MTSMESERELVRELSRLLDDETMPHAVRAGKIQAARTKLRAFYRHHGLYTEPQYFTFDDASKSLVLLNPAAMKQSGWGYKG